jgi:hypothetical protein
MIKAVKKLGRPPKAEPTKYVSVHIPIASKKELDAIREKIEAQVGFSVSMADTILHLIKTYTPLNRSGKA